MASLQHQAQAFHLLARPEITPMLTTEIHAGCFKASARPKRTAVPLRKPAEVYQVALLVVFGFVVKARSARVQAAGRDATSQPAGVLNGERVRLNTLRRTGLVLRLRAWKSTSLAAATRPRRRRHQRLAMRVSTDFAVNHSLSQTPPRVSSAYGASRPKLAGMQG
jgi:hypothetical protein